MSVTYLMKIPTSVLKDYNQVYENDKWNSILKWRKLFNNDDKDQLVFGTTPSLKHRIGCKQVDNLTKLVKVCGLQHSPAHW